MRPPRLRTIVLLFARRHRRLGGRPDPPEQRNHRRSRHHRGPLHRRRRRHHGRARRGPDDGPRRGRRRDDPRRLAAHARDRPHVAHNLVEAMNAIVLSGGSAYGIAAASGVMRCLEARGIGFPVGGPPPSCRSRQRRSR